MSSDLRRSYVTNTIRVIVLATVLIAAASANCVLSSRRLSPAEAQAVPLRTVGDVTRDGVISAGDALAILQYSVGIELPEGFLLDPDGDGACLADLVPAEEEGTYLETRDRIVHPPSGPISPVDALAVLKYVVRIPSDSTCVGFQPDPAWDLTWSHFETDTLTVLGLSKQVRPEVSDTSYGSDPAVDYPWIGGVHEIEGLRYQSLIRIRSADPHIVNADTLTLYALNPIAIVHPNNIGSTEIIADWFGREIRSPFHVMPWEPVSLQIDINEVPTDFGARADTLVVGDSTNMAVQAQDSMGFIQVLVPDSVSWTIRDPSILAVSQGGEISAVGPGRTWVRGDWSTFSDSTQVTVLSNSESVSDLIGKSLNYHFQGHTSYGGPGLFMSNATFQHNAQWANAGMEVYGRIPRVALANDPSDSYYRHLARVWDYSYRTLSVLSDALKKINSPAFSEEFGPESVVMYRAFGKLVQGLSLGSIALLYDRGFVLDETTTSVPQQAPFGEDDLRPAQSVSPDRAHPEPEGVSTLDYGPEPEDITLLDYASLMDIALSYLDEAIALSEGTAFTLPFDWIPATVDAPLLARLAHSYKARLMAQVARTPSERRNVDWAQIIWEADRGIQDTFMLDFDEGRGWYHETLDYGTQPLWSQLTYFTYGMADSRTDRAYSDWLGLPMTEKAHILPDGRPVLIVSPDLRFPRGATVEDQRANPGLYFRIATPGEEGDTWTRPERGTWRWSWYKDGFNHRLSYGWSGQSVQPEIQLAEMRLLKAEALYWLGDPGSAAAIINETRTAAGLSSTDLNGTNTSCVPRLPNGSCGDLLEMLKWEKRMETVWTGVGAANWWFDARGWGDLWMDSPLQLPIPCADLQEMKLACYTFGGPGGEMSAARSVYAFPFEGEGE